MSEHTIGCGAALAPTCLLAAALSGCANPLASRPSDYGPPVPRDRIRHVERLDLADYAAPVDAAGVVIEREVQQLARRFDRMDRVELTIEEARALALEHNLNLRVSLIDPVIAAERIGEEEGRFEALFIPSLRYTETDQPTASTLVGSQVDALNFQSTVRVPLRTGGNVDIDYVANRTETNNEFTFLNPAVSTGLGVSISQPLLRNAGRRANTHAIRVAALNTGISEARTKLQIISQLSGVDRAYWRLYAARQELDVRQQQYELAAAQLERARRRVEAGADSEIEIIRAEEGVAQRLEAIIQSENQVLEFQRELKRVVNAPGLDVTTGAVIVPSSPPDPIAYDLDVAPLLTAAVANRMELLELELQLAIDSSAVDFATNQARSRLDVGASYTLNGLGGTYGDATDQLVDRDFADWSVSLNAEFPLGGNVTGESRVRQAVLTRLQRIGTREARVQTIEQEVLNAADRIDSGWRRVLAARQSAILAARTLGAEQRQFEVGRRTSTDVLDAATRLADAQSAEIRALTDYQIAQVDLAVATGTLLGASRVDWAPFDPTGTLLDESARTAPAVSPGAPINELGLARPR